MWDIDISLLMKYSKSVTLTSRSVRRWGVGGGMEQRKILDQYRTSGIVSTRSIQKFKRYPILKTFNQNLKRKIFKVCDLDRKVNEGVGMVQHYILEQYLASGKVSTRSS